MVLYAVSAAEVIFTVNPSLYFYGFFRGNHDDEMLWEKPEPEHNVLHYMIYSKGSSIYARLHRRGSTYHGRWHKTFDNPVKGYW